MILSNLIPDCYWVLDAISGHDAVVDAGVSVTNVEEVEVLYVEG